MPDITFKIQPSENGKVLYQRVAPPVPEEPARAMAYFLLQAHNHTGSLLTARELVVSFPGSNQPDVPFPSRDVEIPAGQIREVGLGEGEEIVLPANVPPKIRITLTVDGLADPVVEEWPLQAHTKTYDFFAKLESDPDFGEFILMPGRHVDGGGGQHFGYDVNVRGVHQPSGTLSEKKTNDDSKNSNRFAWERPIYAMADGEVALAIDEHPDNPSPDGRSFARKDGEFQSKDPIGSLAVAGLTSSRMIAAAVLENGDSQVIALEQSPDGHVLEKLSEAKGPKAESIAVVGVTSTRAVTASSETGGVRLTLWSLKADGSSLTPLSDQLLPGLGTVRLAKLSGNRVAVMAQNVDEELSLQIHAWSDAGIFGTAALDSDQGGKMGAFDLVALSSTRLVGALETEGHRLKLIVWDLVEGALPGTISLSRVGLGAGKGEINDVSIVKLPASVASVCTAVRGNSGKLKLIAWDVEESGEVVRRGSVEDTESAGSTGLDLCFFKSEALALGYRTPAGKLRIAAWDLDRDKDTQEVTYSRLDQHETHGTTDLFALAQVPSAQETLVSAVRTQGGKLKIILWQFTDTNRIYILHGNEVVLFAHLRQDSIPAPLKAVGALVSKGQMIGRIGHSGKSGGPHCHIHAVRVREDLLANDIFPLSAALAAGETVGELRPLHFKGVLTRRSAGTVPGTFNNSWTSLTNGQGMYFESYVVRPSE